MHWLLKQEKLIKLSADSTKPFSRKIKQSLDDMAKLLILFRKLGLFCAWFYMTKPKLVVRFISQTVDASSKVVLLQL